MPDFSRLSIQYCKSGLFLILISGLGVLLVNGSIRLPKPAANINAVSTLFFFMW